ncbi:hypothetical protein [Sphaerisporangium corydalis]|uniref:Secreted protein n=1 Tax=Sphaerisporangium corydalis TaxID=1441875 RepID=A0ABV9EJD4_9ACTN|nr:hypothetical protein [Sphaerisporangium corydalis]
MSTSLKVGAYALGLVVIFGGAFGAGKAAGAVGLAPPRSTEATHTAMNRPDLPPSRHDTATTTSDGPDEHSATGGHGEHSASPGDGGQGRAVAAPIPGGLQVSQNGYTLSPVTTTVRAGEATDFRFTVTGPDGRPVTAYQVRHGKRLHFIVVDRGLGTFRHLHPSQDAGGVWSVRLTLPEPGAYRAFADFAPEGGEALTLGVDLDAPGDHTTRALPGTGRTVVTGGYTVSLRGDLVPGRSSELTLNVVRDGRPVTDLQPYLGAYGHLVALRAGDLAYLHVHPDGQPGDGRTSPGPDVTFHAEVPSRGEYRLFLDFQHNGTVHTAAFTTRAG